MRRTVTYCTARQVRHFRSRAGDGKIATGENIVLVIAASSHRQAAFDGANFVMDYLKTSAPFWKKEHGKDGSAGDWVAAKTTDDAAKDKWR